MSDTNRAKVRRLAEYLSREIPLTTAMQVEIDHWEIHSLVVSAPLQPNRNHKATAFGGSLYSLAVLACWGLFVMRLWEEGLDCEIVIQEAKAAYLMPVNSRLVARCNFTDDKTWSGLMAQLRRRGRARIALGAEILTGEDAAFTLHGRFVAIVS